MGRPARSERSAWTPSTEALAAAAATTTPGDFFADFAQSTRENWQSEFLQLFAFVVMASLYIHKGSAESKDGTEKVEASLRRIEEHLGTLPPDAPDGEAESWKLPDTPLRSSENDVGPRVRSQA